MEEMESWKKRKKKLDIRWHAGGKKYNNNNNNKNPYPAEKFPNILKSGYMEPDLLLLSAAVALRRVILFARPSYCPGSVAERQAFRR